MDASSQPTDAPVLRSVTETRRFATARSVLALMLREMSTSYGRSPGGYIWAVLEPVAGIVLLVLIFSLMVRHPPLGTNFAIFYATGLVPFMMYMGISSKVAGALTFSHQLLVYPSVTFVDAILARYALDFLTQLLVSYIIISGILMMFDTQTALDFPGIALAYGLLGALALGVGVLNCFLSTMFPLWTRIWAIMNRPLLLVSGIIFLPENVPEPYRTYMLYNPLVHVIGQMRKSFYPYYDAPYVSATYVFGISLILTAAGMLFLLRYHRDMLNK